MQDIVVFSPADQDWPPAKRLAREPGVELLPPSESAGFVFNDGAVHVGRAYGRHPMRPHYLVPLGEIDTYLLAERFSEVLRVLNSLGAAQIDCSSYSERKKNWGFRAKVQGNGADGSVLRRVASSFDYHHEGHGSPPVDPRPLVWPHEPGLDSAIEAVLKNQASVVRVTIRRDMAAVGSSGLRLKLKEYDVDLGAERTSDAVDKLEFEARFNHNAGRRSRRR